MSKTEIISVRVPAGTKEKMQKRAQQLGFVPNDVISAFIRDWAEDPQRLAMFRMLRESEKTGGLMALLNVNLEAVKRLPEPMPKEVQKHWEDFANALKEYVVAQVPALIEKLKEEQKVTA